MTVLWRLCVGHFRVRRVCVLYRSANPRQSRHPCLFSSEHLMAPLAEAHMMINSTPSPPLPNSLEDSLIQVSDILRCASATAYETGDNLDGLKRDLAFSVVHLINMAKAELERSLECVQNPDSPDET
ncbi:hypothetical protein ALP49_00446 [Pseudomonas syringae pv. solidagae]|nr:hypothetical protein ALP49_00446 [Pseudomonas syringae pv. solidagae]